MTSVPLLRSSGQRPEDANLLSESGSTFGSCLGCAGRQEMTVLETLRLSPFQKWRKFGRFPWKFMVNVLLLVLTTVQVLMVNAYVAPYQRSQFESWQSLLGPPEDKVAWDKMGAKKTFYIYKIETLRQSVEHIVNLYYEIQNRTVDYFEYTYNDEDFVKPIELTVQRYKAGTDIFDPYTKFDNSIEKELFYLRQNDLGPFGSMNTKIADFIYTLVEMKLEFSLRNYDIRYQNKYCYVWDVMSTYDFRSRGRIELQFSTRTRLCQAETTQPWYRRQSAGEIIIFSLIFFLSFVSQILTLKAIIQAVFLYQATKEKLKGAVLWRELPISKKMKFFNVWFFISSISNICNIIGSFLSIEYDLVGSNVTKARLLLNGIGCMMAWVTMVQYFEHSSSYYVLILTLKRGTPRVVRFVLGVLPVFLGYAIFGVAYFSSSSASFASLDSASVTLFCLLNGDVIHDVFDELYPDHSVVSRIYLYTFISLFIYAVLNIFIAIVEDAFFASKAFSMKASQPTSEIWDLLDAPPVDATPLLDMEKRMEKNQEHIWINDHKISDLSIPVESHNLFKEVVDKEDVKSISEFHKEISQIFESRILDIEMKILSIVSDPSIEYSFRPPHPDSFYPCGFSDCVYCLLKIRCEEALEKLNYEVESLKKQYDSSVQEEKELIDESNALELSMSEI